MKKNWSKSVVLGQQQGFYKFMDCILWSSEERKSMTMEILLSIFIYAVRMQASNPNTYVSVCCLSGKDECFYCVWLDGTKHLNAIDIYSSMH